MATESEAYLILSGNEEHCISSPFGVNLAATHVVFESKGHGAISTPV